MFYENFLDALDLLPEGEREKACYEFCKYGITGELPEDRSLAMFCIGVSASVHKYDGRGGARDGAGRKSKQSEISEKQTDSIDLNNSEKSKESKNSKNSEFSENSYSTNININRNINLKKDNINVIQKKFKKPTVNEVNAYCKERNNGISAEQFIDFYESKGWKIGNQPMKDWKAAVRTWERRQPDIPKQQQQIFFNSYRAEKEQKELEQSYRQAELTKKLLAEQAMKRGA